MKLNTEIIRDTIREIYTFLHLPPKKSNAGYAGQVETTHQDGHL